jgi:hypothetical protein
MREVTLRLQCSAALIHSVGPPLHMHRKRKYPKKDEKDSDKYRNTKIVVSKRVRPTHCSIHEQGVLEKQNCPPRERGKIHYI